MLKSKWSFVKKVLAIVVLTLAFEIIQFIFVIGRTDITDVLSNTLGGVIGIGIYALAFKFMKGKTNKVINVPAAVLTIFALLFITLSISLTFKKHIGLYPGGEATSRFAERLEGCKASKGAIQLPLGKPIDYELITDIVRWRVKQAEG